MQDLLEIDSSGRIITATASALENITFKMLIWRFLSNGTIDESFGHGGCVDYSGQNNLYDFYTLNSLVLDSAGRMIIGGYVFTTENYEAAAVWCFNADGTIDSTFGENGIAVYNRTVEVPGYGAHLLDMALDFNDRIFIVCSGSPSNKIIILCYSSNGILDTSFGTNGKILYNISEYENYSNIDLDNKGRILVLGNSTIYEE